MIYPKIPLAQSIIEIFRAKGIRHIVISPGSRNAPLTIGFASHPDFICYSIADERCAAFFALGIAQQLQQPVAVFCTSGSAVLNFYPAFAEAFYSQIPLIAVSADRPKDKIDIGDGQTIRQANVFENHSLFNANLDQEASASNDLLINQAINMAASKKGPVHINVPFEEPLYETTTTLLVDPKLVSSQGGEFILDEPLSAFAHDWNRAKKKLVLVGANYPHAVDPAVIDRLANDRSVAIMTETTSNLHHENVISNIDTIITPFTHGDFEDFCPDLLITFGGLIVSKRIKAFLRKYRPKQHWHIDALRAYDTFGCLTKHFKTSPNVFFSTFFPLTESIASDYNAKMRALKTRRAEKHREYLDSTPFTDLKAFEKILQALPRHIQLQVGNSSPIRYVQLFPVDASVEVFCNRGTSGIDGSTSTAIGAAAVNNKPTVLITGDIGFLYDSNALWNNYIARDFKIILINNGGGGIFRILPGHTESPVFNTYFETSHQLTAAHLCKMYGLDYFTAHDENSLEDGLGSLFAQNQAPALLEVFTPTAQNDKVLLDYFRNLV